jgi:hypothetical protein
MTYEEINKLPPKDRIAAIDKKLSAEASDARQARMEAYSALSAEADANNPNRIKHKLTTSDLDGIVTNVARFGVVRRPPNSKLGEPLQTVHLAINKYVTDEGKHSEWASTVKYRQYYGDSVVDSIERLSIMDIEVEHFYRGLKLYRIPEKSSLNQALTELIEEHEMRFNTNYLMQEDSQKEERISKLEEIVDRQEGEISDLKKNVLVNRQDNWEQVATKLLSEGIIQSEVAETVGKSLRTVKRLAKKIKQTEEE